MMIKNQRYQMANNVISNSMTTSNLLPNHHHHQRLQHKRQQILLQHQNRPTLIRSSEYKNLRQVVPSLRRQRDVGKVEVVTEAARYIDHLHKTLIERFVLCGIPDSLKDILGTGDANELNSKHIMNLVTSMANSAANQEMRSTSGTQVQRGAIGASAGAGQTQMTPNNHNTNTPLGRAVGSSNRRILLQNRSQLQQAASIVSRRVSRYGSSYLASRSNGMITTAAVASRRVAAMRQRRALPIAKGMNGDSRRRSTTTTSYQRTLLPAQVVSAASVAVSNGSLIVRNAAEDEDPSKD